MVKTNGSYIVIGKGSCSVQLRVFLSKHLDVFVGLVVISLHAG